MSLLPILVFTVKSSRSSSKISAWSSVDWNFRCNGWTSLKKFVFPKVPATRNVPMVIWRLNFWRFCKIKRKNKNIRCCRRRTFPWYFLWIVFISNWQANINTSCPWYTAMFEMVRRVWSVTRRVHGRWRIWEYPSSPNPKTTRRSGCRGRGASVCCHLIKSSARCENFWSASPRCA